MCQNYCCLDSAECRECSWLPARLEEKENTYLCYWLSSSVASIYICTLIWVWTEMGDNFLISRKIRIVKSSKIHEKLKKFHPNIEIRD